MNLIGLNSKCWQSCVFSGGSREKSISCLSHLLEDTCVPWLMAPFIHCQSQRTAESFSCCYFSDSLFSASLFHFHDPCNYIGSAQLIWYNLPISKSISNLNYICNLNFPLSFNLNLFMGSEYLVIDIFGEQSI